MNVAVVVPVRNEQERLGRCLAAVRAAGPDRIIVVLDSCTDRSAEIAAGTDRVVTDVRDAGLARAAGCAAALHGTDPGTLWIATTDADSIVPPHWLRGQRELAADGWAAVAGTITIGDWQERPATTRKAYEALLTSRELPGGRHTHAYGANLGVRGDAYLAAGGFGPAPGEDLALIRAVQAAGFRTVSSTSIPVTTSARRDGRAPGGLSDLLDRLTPDDDLAG